MNPSKWEKTKLAKILKTTAGGFHSWVEVLTGKGEKLTVKKPNNKIPVNCKESGSYQNVKFYKSNQRRVTNKTL